MNVANAMAVELSIDERQDLEQIPTDSVRAYQLYLAAGEAWRASLGPEAMDLIDEALAADPEFALAWARKSRLRRSRRSLHE